MFFHARLRRPITCKSGAACRVAHEIGGDEESELKIPVKADLISRRFSRPEEEPLPGRRLARKK